MSNRLNIIRKTLIEFYNHIRNYGIKYAFFNLMWWANFYIVTPWRFKFSKWALLNITKRLIIHIESKYKKIIDLYDKNIECGDRIPSPIIWFFWGQGEVNMPLLIKACYNQLRANNDNVRLVTNENIKSLIDIPNEVLVKLNTCKITWAHFSDIVRMALLKKYGGLWLDATCWVPSAIPFGQLSMFKIYSPNSVVDDSSKSMCFWTSLERNWSGWCLWASTTNPKLFSFVCDMLINMAVQEPMTMHYVLIDFLIYYAINRYPDIKEEMEYIKCLPANNRNQLAIFMNQKYDEYIYNKLCQSDFVFKLSYRANWKSTTQDAEQTFYGKLISETD